MNRLGALRIPRTATEAQAIDELVALAQRREAQRARERAASAQTGGWYDREVPLESDLLEDGYGEESQP